MKKEQDYSTINLHSFKNNIYLGNLSEEPLQTISDDISLSFFGGSPNWLEQPKQPLVCEQCKIPLVFLGQIYCPFNDYRCYHRILYILFCGKCVRQYKCIRQQKQQNWKKPQKNIKCQVKTLQKSYEILSESYNHNEFNKLMGRIKLQIQQQQAIEQAESDEEQDMQMMESNKEVLEQFKKYEEESGEKVQLPKEEQGTDKQQKDIIFEVYKRVINELDNPCILYTDIPLPYNKRVLNPEHFCKGCGSKLSLEVQITERILSLENNPNSQLLLMDWGSIMIYTCVASCNLSHEECVVVQYEIDAIADEDIKKLKKTKKNRKKKQTKKSKSKEKNNQNENENENETKNEEENKNQQGREQQGDWD